ncbi:intradiol ring-cleavage dioxygenase [Gracilimonas sp.]|uniref:intradiol ring-cleavage dioxygenase n=1 Tax=Gracilimonas sp. TaxID=1974203 RepID=UPI003BACEE8F
MHIIKLLLSLIILMMASGCSFAQESALKNARLVGGPCQGCEAVLDYGDRTLIATDTLPEFEQNEPRIKITGTVYQADGVTPAEGVILFVHQTNAQGEYPKRGGETVWERSYGYIHGWVQTGADGRYTFFTFKPGKYSTQPAHIHPIILEPNGKYYWVGSYFFEDDPRLRDDQRNPSAPRGGSSGVLSLKEENGILVGERDFILGKNIRGYE